MGSALAKHLAKKNAVVVYDRNASKRKALAEEIGGTERETAAEAIQDAEVIFLAIKPKDLASFAREASEAFTKQKTVISILTGASVAMLRSYFPSSLIVRTMPNLGLLCGQGVTGLVDDPALSSEAKKRVEALFEGMGLNIWLPEQKMEAITALSGSGIGFVLVMIEAMIDGGVHLGFNSSEAREIVLKTMEGAVGLMRASGKHPGELKLQISSPGGTTIAGLKVMEETGVRSGIMKTLLASYERALNMLKIKNI